MLSAEEIMQLLGSLIWLLAGVGVFIVGMNFMGDALEKSAGNGMKRLLFRRWYWCRCYGHYSKLVGNIGYGYRSC